MIKGMKLQLYNTLKDVKYTTGIYRFNPKGSGAHVNAPTSSMIVAVALLPNKSYKIPPKSKTIIEPIEAYVIELVLISAALGKS
jgi:hypothetical protein